MGLCLLLFTHYCFWNSNALSRELLSENGQIATQGHSRSFILQSITGRQYVQHIAIIILLVLGPIPKVSEEVATEVAKSYRRRQPTVI